MCKCVSFASLCVMVVALVACGEYASAQLLNGFCDYGEPLETCPEVYVDLEDGNAATYDWQVAELLCPATTAAPIVTYTVNVCRDVISTHTDGTVQYQRLWGIFYNISSVGNAGTEFKMFFTDGDAGGCPSSQSQYHDTHRSVSVDLTCSPTATAITCDVSQMSDALCSGTLKMTVPSVQCPEAVEVKSRQPRSEGGDAGLFFGVSIMILVIALGAGTFYNQRARGITGLSSIPGYDLICAGVSWAMGKMRGGHAGRSYGRSDDSGLSCGGVSSFPTPPPAAMPSSVTMPSSMAMPTSSSMPQYPSGPVGGYQSSSGYQNVD